MKKLGVPRLYRSMSDYDTFHYVEPDRERIRRAVLRDFITLGKIDSIDALIENIREGYEKSPTGYGIIYSDGRTYRVGLDINDKMMYMSGEDYGFFMSGRIVMDFDYIIQVIREVKLKSLNFRVTKTNH